MNNIDKILVRLYSALKISKDKEFCDKYDIKANTVSSWKKRNSVPYELIQEISQNENISFDWILSGKGSMYLKEDSIAQNNSVMISGNTNNSNIINGNISINTSNFNHSEDIKDIVELLQYAPSNFLMQIKERLEKFKELSQI